MTGGMTIPRSQVDTFLSTLQDYSTSCAASRRAVEEPVPEVKEMVYAAKKSVTEVKKIASESTKASMKVYSDVKKLWDEVKSMVATQREQHEQMRSLVERVDNRAVEIEKKVAEVSRAMEQIETKETFVCALSDVAKESERMTRRLYTRTLYSGTLCREIATAALQKLEATIRIVQTIAVNMCTAPERRNDDMDIGSASDGISTNSATSTLGALVSRVLFKTRYLKKGVQTVERAAELMEEVGFLDNYFRVATG